MITVTTNQRVVTAISPGHYKVSVQPVQRTVKVSGARMAFVPETYVHTQATPASIWNVTHGMGKYPAVVIVTSLGVQTHGRVTYVDDNNVTIEFNSALQGNAYCN